MKQRLIDANKLNVDHVKASTATNRLLSYISKEQVDNAPTVEAIPKELYEQVQWERDIALSQLKQLNIEFGEKPYHKAIPVEWIREWIKTEPLGVGSLIAPEYTIEAMLYWWEKEKK